MDKIKNFNPGRMMSLVGKIIMEQPKVFIMRMLLLLGALTVGAVFVGMVDVEHYRWSRSDRDWAHESELAYFMVMLFVLGFVYTSMAFNEARNKPGRISMLMLPARYSEKYSARFIIYVPLFLIMFAAAMWIADAVRVFSLSIFYPEFMHRVEFLTISEDNYRDISQILAVFVAMQSFYWLGAILWPRNSFIKSFSAVTLLGVFYTAITPILYFVIIGRENNICRVEWLEDLNPEKSCIFWTVSTVVCLVNYTLAYIRLKESDVIQRLL